MLKKAFINREQKITSCMKSIYDSIEGFENEVIYLALCRLSYRYAALKKLDNPKK